MSETTENTLAAQLAEFAHSVRYEDLPLEVVDSVKSRLLDILGICAAAVQLETSRAVRTYVAAQGGREQANAIGIASGLPASQAALVNGVLAHSLDYDDTHLPSVLHPSATVIPAVLAAAQAKGATGKETICAIAIGLEICVRLGMAGYDSINKNSNFFENGQHATSICGSMGAAAAIASMYKDADLVRNALGVTASMASGIIEANRTGGTVKRIHCGWAAHSAVVAVDLVRSGLTGPPTVLEGRFGFYQAWLGGKFDSSQITSGLGKTWSIENIFFKPYPANHFTHAAIDAAAEVRRAGIDPNDIETMILGVPAPNLRTIGEPIEVKRRPETAYMAQFSAPYAVVAGLLGGGGLEVGLDDYTDSLAQDPYRRQLMAKVDVIADDRCTAVFPMQFPAILRVTLKGGKTIEKKVMNNRGGNKRPLSFEELKKKFRDNTSRTMKTPEITRLEEICESFESQVDIASLFTDLVSVDSL